MRGKFITVEGIEGVGKSTLIQGLAHFLKEKNCAFIQTREPGGTPFAEELRRFILHPIFDEHLTNKTELLLLFAARSQHIENVILPHLEKGDWVLSDRFVDATYAYQGGGRGFPLSFIGALEKWVLADLQADLTFILDAPVELALKRAKNRSELDRIESESIAFFERVREGYLKRMAQAPNRYQLIDATQSPEQVLEQALRALEQV